VPEGFCGAAEVSVARRKVLWRAGKFCGATEGSAARRKVLRRDGRFCGAKHGIHGDTDKNPSLHGGEECYPTESAVQTPALPLMRHRLSR
jgi:hypothetical protein